ncbi:Allene oxide synthase-lipoxygenase protein [Trichoplax sp. H2]|nr:Allene oxide synthase-lipoxygenase protein [Trichoplax sp. H2]|eukprot:RDD45151.1 Allene oxide synthase-lipoxygenase protein [Trichoplax sp. H2]
MRRERYVLDLKFPGFPIQVKQLPREEMFNEVYSNEIFCEKVGKVLTDAAIGWVYGSWSSLPDISSIYRDGTDFHTPSGQFAWDQDFHFTNQRLQGVNPVVLELCTAILSAFKVTNNMIKPFLEGNTLDQAIKTKKMFICDLTMLQNVPVGGSQENKELINS